MCLCCLLFSKAHKAVGTEQQSTIARCNPGNHQGCLYASPFDPLWSDYVCVAWDSLPKFLNTASLNFHRAVVRHLGPREPLLMSMLARVLRA